MGWVLHQETELKPGEEQVGDERGTGDAHGDPKNLADEDRAKLDEGRIEEGAKDDVDKLLNGERKGVTVGPDCRRLGGARWGGVARSNATLKALALSRVERVL